MGLIPTAKPPVIGQFANGRNATDDFLQLASSKGGTVFGWIDSDGHLQGSLASGVGVSSINSLSGAITLAAGTNVVITPSGNTLTISSTVGTPAQGQFFVSTNCLGVSNCFQVKADAQVVSDASYTSGGSTITTGVNDPPFCNGTTLPCTAAQIAVGHITDVGMIAVALGNCNPNAEMNCKYDCPQGTITAVNSAHSVTISTVCARNSSVTANSNNFYWGSDDSTQLTAAWVAAQNLSQFTAPATIQLPCGRMLMGTQSFVAGFAVPRYSVGMSGCGDGNPTEIIPLPKMDCTGAIGGAKGCLLLAPYNQDVLGNFSMNASYSNILFNGYGLPDKDSAAIVNTGQSGIYAGLLVNLYNMAVQGWMWNRSLATPVYGLNCAGCSAFGMNIFGGGNIGAFLQGFTNILVSGSLHGGSIGASLGPSIDIGPGQTEIHSVYVNQSRAGCFATSNCYGIRNLTSGSNFTAYGGNITTGIWTDVGARSNIIGADLNGLNFSTYSFYLNGGTLALQNTSIQGQAHIASGTFIDQGGNTSPAVFGGYDAISGIIQADGHSLKGTCTGVATASQTLGLYGTGPNVTATTCTSTTVGSGVPMQGARTLSTLVVTATAGGVNGSSGVVTVLKNGSSTALTCTLGTGTSCFDGTHSVAAADGDLISIQFTTQGGETLAGVKAFIEW